MSQEEAANSTAHQLLDQSRQAAETARNAVKNRYEGAQQYIREKTREFELGDFVHREPWIAIAVAFALGYVGSRLVRRLF
jgi:ElaB/YqjD/DUF883 family membrane-anchored ribosome-binding protein